MMQILAMHYEPLWEGQGCYFIISIAKTNLTYKRDISVFIMVPIIWMRN